MPTKEPKIEIEAIQLQNVLPPIIVPFYDKKHVMAPMPTYTNPKWENYVTPEHMKKSIYTPGMDDGVGVRPTIITPPAPTIVIPAGGTTTTKTANGTITIKSTAQTASSTTTSTIDGVTKTTTTIKSV